MSSRSVLRILDSVQESQLDKRSASLPPWGAMNNLTDPVLQRAVAELANALQSAVLLAQVLDDQLGVSSQDARALRQAVTRAAVILRDLQPQPEGPPT